MRASCQNEGRPTLDIPMSKIIALRTIRIAERANLIWLRSKQTMALPASANRFAAPKRSRA
jgi:hypothetical protein